MAGLDQRGRAGAGLHHPRVPQPFIETLALQATPIRGRSLFCSSFDAFSLHKPVPASLENALAILAVGGELFLQRRQFGKRRIGVDRTLALARRRCGRVLAVRRPAIGTLVAAALVAPTPKLA